MSKQLQEMMNSSKKRSVDAAKKAVVKSAEALVYWLA